MKNHHPSLPNLKTKDQRPKTNSGFSLLETLLAGTIFSIVIITTLLATSQLTRSYAFSDNRFDATLIADSMIEQSINALQWTNDWDTALGINIQTIANNATEQSGLVVNPETSQFTNSGTVQVTRNSVTYDTDLTIRGVCREAGGARRIVEYSTPSCSGNTVDRASVEVEATVTWTEPSAGNQEVSISTIVSNLDPALNP